MANTLSPETAKAPTPSRPSFEQLPSEIRIMILEALLKAPTPFDLSHAERSKLEAHWSRFRHLARQASSLLLTNKRTHATATSVLYGANEFHFTNRHGWRMLDLFLSAVGDANARFLKKLAIRAPFLRYGGAQQPGSTTTSSSRNTDSQNTNAISAMIGAVSLPAPATAPPPHWLAGLDKRARAHHVAVVGDVCQRLRALGGLTKLRLLLPVDAFAAPDGPFDYLTDALVCDDGCAETNDLAHVRRWHQDRWFWDELEGLRDGVDIGFVLVHETWRGARADAFEYIYTDRLMAEMYLWLLYRARAKGYRVGYGYDGVDRGDGVLDLRNEGDPDVLEPIVPGWRFPDGEAAAEKYGRPSGEPEYDEFRSCLRAGYLFGDDESAMLEHGPLAFRKV
ncbi:putative twin-arginine translocation pathway signal sequence [Diplodia seriata]|uniref:Putative twin-arginine translocation pathway signal sequence n=1 Tax=Diplodia seriata TaxID=420778 RepID=A0A0G2GUA2_9PEZI|nr:putative twin-arginine translocation pathway signal sequence [Diplodia seriata]